MIRVKWLSRHSMTADQFTDLCKMLRVEVKEVAITSENIIWAATADRGADLEVNAGIWRNLEMGCDILAGVFPPVALEAQKIGLHLVGTLVVSPVSRQAPELRVGDGSIPFQHVRWAIIS